MINTLTLSVTLAGTEIGVLMSVLILVKKQPNFTLGASPLPLEICKASKSVKHGKYENKVWKFLKKL